MKKKVLLFFVLQKKNKQNMIFQQNFVKQKTPGYDTFSQG